MKTRRIDIANDRDYILECHCSVNYDCDSPWARALPYETYRANWFNMPTQMDGFWQALVSSIEDPRGIAEIMEDDNGKIAGYLWAPFYEDAEAGFSWMDVQDIFIEKAFRGQGLASRWMAAAEKKAKESGAKVIRSGTGCENISSIEMHKRLGYNIYRYEYEKVLN